MKSSFDLNRQNIHTESKIVVALERIAEVFRVLLWNESKDNSLSPIQIQLLIFIQFHDQEKCKVGYLANEFNMTKATISDSVKVLLSKKLVAKETDSIDTRSFTLSLTSKGKQIAEKASFFASPIEKTIGKLSDEQKTVILNGLLQMIYDLNRDEIITIQRMCFTCSYYGNDKGVHYCNLLNTKLAETEIRLDCSEHEMKR
jgi:DNA-binding MarR family transcriptional regulator